jgi:hypothetical protein
MTNASSILSIMKEIDTSNFMAGWFIILALVGFLIVLTSNYDYKGAKAAFVLATFVCANIVGLLWLAGLAALFHLVMALALVVIAILVFFLTGD